MAGLKHIAFALLIFFALAPARADEADSVNVMLDNIQKADESRDIGLLAAQYDEGMLFVVEHPDPSQGSLLLGKQQFLDGTKNQMWQVAGLKARVLSNRRVVVRNDLAFIRMTANDTFSDGRTYATDTIVMAVKRGGVWKICFGMPAIVDWKLVVSDVEAGSAADKAGLAAGDVVVRCGGRPVDPLLFGGDIASLLKSEPGRPVSLELDRRGVKLDAQVPSGCPGATIQIVLTPTGSARFYASESPHPTMELLAAEIEAIRSGRAKGYQAILDQSAYFSYRRESVGSTRLVARADAEETIATQVAESRKALDPSTVQLKDARAIATTNIAIASGTVSAQQANGKSLETQTRLQVFARREGTWRLAADLVDRCVLEAGAGQSGTLGPAETRQADREIQGKITGIGVKLGLSGEGVLIQEALEGKPAQRAGIRGGETILSVDGKAVKGMTIQQVVELILGEEGTQVSLELREPSGDARTVTVVRETIAIPAVDVRVLEGRIGYLRVALFNRETPSAVRSALTAILSAANAQGIVVDLRGNSGGLYDAVLDVARMLISGKPPKVLWTVRQEGQEPKPVEARARALSSLPMVILIDGKTAGGAELLARALKEHLRATVVGSPTAGAAMLKQRIENPDGSSKVVQIGDFLFAGSGKTGTDPVSPDVTVPDGPSPDQALETGRKKLVELLGK